MSGQQLDLLKPKRQRVRKAPPPLEFPIHCMIADTLDRWLSPGWVWFHVPSGEERPSKLDANGRRYSPAGARLKRMGVKPGVADFILIAPGRGRVHTLELKRQGERPTEAQEQFGQRIFWAGGEWSWCDNYSTAVEILTRWGALRVMVRV